MRRFFLGLGCAASLCLATSAQASFIIDIDTDTLDDGPIAYHPNFSFGGDTTTASTSAKSTAVGLAQADSIFGGDGVNFPDTYQVTYEPGVDGDNINLAGQALNDEGDLGSAIVAGGSGEYRIYATWPATNNVSGGLVTFTLTDGNSNLFSVQINQNTAQGFINPTDGLLYSGNEWIYVGTATLDAGTEYTLRQEAGSNTFVSMRAAGYLFDAVPEPASLGLMGMGGLALLSRKRA
jgi:hypothetical protein